MLFDEVTSTNDVGKTIAEKMLSEGEDLPVTALVARHQTAGRGRAGRSWTPPRGTAISISLIVPWPEGEERVRLPLEIGVKIARALSASFGLDVRLKWPNDLLVGRKKLGGILIEARSAEGEGYAVAGIGINATATREELDAAGLTEATSLVEAGASPARAGGDAGVFAILKALDEVFCEPVPSLPEAFASVAAHTPGDRIKVADGGRTVTGVYRGVTADGFLRLDTGSGDETLVAGEVTLF